MKLGHVLETKISFRFSKLELLAAFEHVKTLKFVTASDEKQQQLSEKFHLFRSS